MATRFISLLAILMVAVCAFGQSAVAGTVGTSLTGLPSDPKASVSQQIDWLAGNPQHPSAAIVFTELLNRVQSVAELDAIRLRVIPNLPDSALKLTAMRELAAVYRTARRLDHAEELYSQAYQLSGDSDLASLFALAQVLVDQGELADARAAARTVVVRTTDYSLKRRAYTLSARIAFEEGNTDGALQMLETLAALVENGESAADLVEVESLLLMRELLQISGDSAGADRAAGLIDRLFPDSIAAGIVAGTSRSLSLPALPSALLLSLDEESGPGLPAADGLPSSEAASRNQPRLSAVQVGSFSDEENARHLQEDLSRLGLDARTDAIAREGNTLHQVTVTIPGGSPENAAAVLATLRRNGFDGFLVY